MSLYEPQSNSFTNIAGLIPAIFALYSIFVGLFCVGYFQVVGMEALTLFSFQDHIAFSLTALPFFLAYSYWAIILRINYLDSRKQKLPILWDNIAPITVLILTIIVDFYFKGKVDLTNPNYKLILILFLAISLTHMFKTENFSIFGGQFRDRFLFLILTTSIFMQLGSYFAYDKFYQKYPNYNLNGKDVVIMRMSNNAVIYHEMNSEIRIVSNIQPISLKKLKKPKNKDDFCYNLKEWKKC